MKLMSTVLFPGNTRHERRQRNEGAVRYPGTRFKWLRQNTGIVRVFDYCNLLVNSLSVISLEPALKLPKAIKGVVKYFNDNLACLCLLFYNSHLTVSNFSCCNRSDQTCRCSKGKVMFPIKHT